METGVLSALQLTSMFPEMVLENFYVMTRHSLDDGSEKAPYAYVIPKAPDMTKPATLVNILRAQGIEVGVLKDATVVGADTFPAGSYVVKLNQPYGRLAKNLLEKQIFPDPRLTTYDDSGWSMGWAFDVTVKEIEDKSILDAAVTPVKKAEVTGTVAGSGSAGLAVAHYGSNNMIAFRYLLKNVPMQVADSAFTANGVKFPAGSFIVTGSSSDLAAARHMVDSLGLTAAALASLPQVPEHDAKAPRVAIYSQWSGTQDLGWYRFTFDQFHVPYDLIFKERVAQGNLKKDYDVIVMAVQNINRSAVFAPKAAHPQPYEQSAKYRNLGMYGSTPDMSGGFGQAGVDAIRRVPRRRRHADHRGAGGQLSDRLRPRALGGGAESGGRDGAEAARDGAHHPHRQPDLLRIRQRYDSHKVQPGRAGVPHRRRRFDARARRVRGRRRVGAERSDDRRRQPAEPALRGGHLKGARRQRARDHVRQQSGLPVAEPRRVQHDVQRHHQLERSDAAEDGGARWAVDGAAPVPCSPSGAVG